MDTNHEAPKVSENDIFWQRMKLKWTFVYGLIGGGVVISLLTIEIYQQLIWNNRCLYYYFYPKCNGAG